MNIDKIQNCLNEHEDDTFINPSRYAAVMIPIIDTESGPALIFEKRAENISQSGDISFPGGHVDLGETYEKAAIRETMEELLISRENIRVLGKLGNLYTSGGLYTQVYVSEIVNIPLEDIEPNPSEVAEIFAINIDTLLSIKPDAHETRLKEHMGEDFPYHLIEGGKNYRQKKIIVTHYFYKVSGRVIWGFTGKILKVFLKLLSE